jgi:hypothetical protein
MEKLQQVEKDPAIAGLVPALCFAFNYQNRDEEGHIFEWCPYPFFDIGWFTPKDAAAQGFVELEIVGLRILAPPDTLERLVDKKLVLEMVEVGFPRPPDKRVKILRSVPK